MLDRCFRSLCAAQAGAQLCFVAAATQVLFPASVAALPHSDPRRALAADQVGALLLRIDAATLIVSAASVGIAWRLAARGAGPGRRALAPLLAGLCALASLFGTTPAIQALRASGQTSGARFGAMHALSSGLLLLEIALFAWAALRAGERGLTTRA